MCEFASIVLIKEQAFWALVDSHEEIIRKHGLHADGVGGPNVLRVEICPPSLDGVGLRAPLAEWTYRVDQDIMPEWADAERDEERARLALAELVAERVIVDRTHIKKITEGVYYLIHNATVDAMGNATVDARDKATVDAMGNATVTAWDNATVTARGNATVGAVNDHATVRAYNPQPDVEILGPYAVLIDCTGERAVCRVGE